MSAKAGSRFSVYFSHMRAAPKTAGCWTRSAKPGRVGFTLVELLVVITIIALLVALLLPAVMSARGAGRRMQCKNNLRNIGLAMLSETEAQGRFPASGNWKAGRPHHNWVVTLLAWLERADIADRWDFDRPSDDPANERLASITLPILVCPDDDTAVPGEGNLSYVVNSGYGWMIPYPAGGPGCPAAMHARSSPTIQPIDLHGNGVICPADPADDGTPSDEELFRHTGLFFLENWPLGSGGVIHHTPDSVLDGLSNTLMLSENVRAGFDPATNENWASPRSRRNSFCISGYVCDSLSCSPGDVDYRRANDQGRDPYRLEAINSSLDQPEGQAPWPSSYHPGGVHVVFADGHVDFLSENVEGGVYASLMSPRGSSIKGPLQQPILSAEDY